MSSVAPGVSELRLRSEDGQFRVFYFTANEEDILVPHAFVKKPNKRRHRIFNWRGSDAR